MAPVHAVDSLRPVLDPNAFVGGAYRAGFSVWPTPVLARGAPGGRDARVTADFSALRTGSVRQLAR
jgi:hypothetical protein